MIIPYEPKLLPVIQDAAKRFHVESRFREMPYSEDKITQLLNNPNVFCVLAKISNRYIGGMIGMVQEHWFSEARIGFNLGLYILPEYRGKSSAPIRLLKAFEGFCHSKNCFEIVLGSNSGIHEQRALRLYENLGYEKSGFVSHKRFAPSMENT
jgi:GNAT superfamily N-acetyltransferase